MEAKLPKEKWIKTNWYDYQEVWIDDWYYDYFNETIFDIWDVVFIHRKWDIEKCVIKSIKYSLCSWWEYMVLYNIWGEYITKDSITNTDINVCKTQNNRD